MCIYSLNIQHTNIYHQTCLTLAGAGAGSGFPGASGTCGPPRRPFNLPNMSRILKGHLLCRLQVTMKGTDS